MKEKTKAHSNASKRSDVLISEAVFPPCNKKAAGKQFFSQNPFCAGEVHAVEGAFGFAFGG